MQKQTYISTACLFVSCLAISAAAQTGLNGNWKWESESVEDKNLPSFSIRLKSKSGKVNGHLYFVTPTNE